ncbi:MAG TPA: HNH endonuclease [Methanofastidiosum sp.]|nr:HNH endonuclease [Methanofastidiosum sp.]
MTDVLVLNSGFIPLYVVSDRRSIELLYQNKAYTVVETEREMRSPSLIFRVPSVIALTEYGEIPRKKVAFSKLNVIYRDDMTCQYCGKRLSMNDLNVDHVIPRCRWTKVRHGKANCTSWENCVCTCRWCNNIKGNKLIEELGWKLLREPYEPKYLPHIVVSFKKAERKGWLPFCKINVKLINMID